MSASDISKNILLKIVSLPQNLLVPNIQNLLKIEFISSSKKEVKEKEKLEKAGRDKEDGPNFWEYGTGAFD